MLGFEWESLHTKYYNSILYLKYNRKVKHLNEGLKNDTESKPE
jgi:hypothetical protein